jgi:hypothetical protein
MRSSAEQTRILGRRAKIAALLVRGVTNQKEIARSLGMGPDVQQPLISRDIAAIRREWRDSALRAFDFARGLELAHLDQLETEAWGAWERSKRPRESSRTRRQTGRAPSDLAGLRTERRDGNPKFLERVLACIDRRIRLLGLDPKLKTEDDGALPDQPSKEMTNEERQAISQTLLNRLAGRFGLPTGNSPVGANHSPAVEPVGYHDPFTADVEPIE